MNVSLTQTLKQLRLSGLAESLEVRLKDIVSASTGSACTTADPEPSHVLLAMGLDEDLIESSVRFGLGRFNTEADVDQAGNAITDAVKKLRKLLRR